MTAEQLSFDLAVVKPEPEEWRPVVGHLGYEVSSLGRVRSLDRITYSEHRSPQRHKGKLLTPVFKNTRRNKAGRQHGYLGVGLENRVIKHVHVLVLEAYRGPRPDGMVARHLNGDHFDNRAENLAWGTQQTNVNDQELHGTMCRGEGRHNAKLTAEDIPEMLAMWNGGKGSITEIARAFNVSYPTAWQVIAGRSWTHVSGLKPTSIPRRR